MNEISQKQLQFILLLLSCIIITLISAKKTDIVSTDKGPIRGDILTTVQNEVEYSAFTGIPFAKPPVGYLRFQPPVDVDKWEKVLETNPNLVGCPQYRNGVVGNEDCLYLNVYTPKTKFNSTRENLRAVIVWIHGGYFLNGAADGNYYGPDFFIEEDIVLVFVNYRLGALGFLNLNHPNATGNAGLKDQVLALKWIQKNVQTFGGDPTRITLLGQSAGSVSVELHGISDMSRGLYNNSISMSGSPLNYWGFSPNIVAQARAFTLGIQLAIPSFAIPDILQTLYDASAEDIILATKRMEQLDLPFKPTLEDPAVSKDPFLHQCAFRAYENGDFRHPHILGFGGQETLAFVPTFLARSDPIGDDEESANERVNFGLAAQMALDAQLTEVNALPSFDLLQFLEPLFKPIEIMEQWTGRVAINLRKMLVMQAVGISTDLFFIPGIDQTQQYRSRSSAPVWYYRNMFDYDRSIHKLHGINLDGTAHGDDIALIFWMQRYSQTLDPNSDISIQRRRIVRMWSNFAKYADPTPNGTGDPLLNITWTPSGTEGTHLEISQDLQLGERPTDWTVKITGFFGNPVEKLLNGCLTMIDAGS